MSKAIKSSKDFVLGRILYHVYGCSHPEGSTGEAQIEKQIVLSKPYPSKFSPNAFFYNYEAQFEGVDEIKTYKSEASLSDAGIFDLDKGRDTPYNLNRLFKSRDDALEFIEELRSGKFSDQLDTKVDRAPVWDLGYYDEFPDDYHEFPDDYDTDGWTGENEGKHS